MIGIVFVIFLSFAFSTKKKKRHFHHKIIDLLQMNILHVNVSPCHHFVNQHNFIALSIFSVIFKSNHCTFDTQLLNQLLMDKIIPLNFGFIYMHNWTPNGNNPLWLLEAFQHGVCFQLTCNYSTCMYILEKEIFPSIVITIKWFLRFYSDSVSVILLTMIVKMSFTNWMCFLSD